LHYGRQPQKRFLSELDAVVFHTAAPGRKSHTFVVPSEILRTRIFQPPITKEDKWIYLPSEKVPRRKKTAPLIDYWDYEDAWQLLASNDARKR
jgi:hypothetical protein